MANVYTKKHHRPRTTTLSHFGPKPTFEPPPLPRILSPTRNCNPHPTGLVYQSPYNRDNMTFAIWNPDIAKVSRKMPKMLSHLERSNFCSGPLTLPTLKRGNPPKMAYTVNTTARVSYQTPMFPNEFRPPPETTMRYGRTPYKPARGIVPTPVPAKYEAR